MKKTRVLLPMILLAVFARGTTVGAHSGQAQEQVAASSDEKSPNGSRAAGSSDTKARGEEDQTTGYSRTNENQKSSAALKAGTRIHRPAVSQAKPPQNRQLHSAKTSAAKGLQTEALQNVPGAHQTSPGLSSSVPAKTVKHFNLPVSPSTVALDGQRFGNSRDPGARMATSGGPANSTRGTAAINGTDVKRKP